MTHRFAVPIATALAALAGLALAAAVPSIPQAARRVAGLPTSPAAAQAKPDGKAEPKPAAAEEKHEDEGKVSMSSEQVAAAGIQVAPLGAGVLVSRVAVPGVLAANQDRLARVTARVGGTVAEVRRSLGDRVAKDDLLVVIESRDIAEAKGEFLAAARQAELAESTLVREARLWKQRVSAEQDYLAARTAAEAARIRVNLARQKLSALGLSDAEVAGLPKQPVALLHRLEVRAPIPGQVTARAAVLGAAVAADAELFSVADLSSLWVEMTIPPRDLPMVQQGQAVSITGEGDAKAEGRIVFLSPLLDADTRSARAVATLVNVDGRWRPGGFVTAHLATAEQQVAILVPRDAVQEVGGEKVVFVRTPDGFEKREVALGREDASAYEAIFGLDAGTEVAVGNAFALKAELGKEEASHGH